jgi:O-antigen/teichoic acid export membrane protein
MAGETTDAPTVAAKARRRLELFMAGETTDAPTAHTDVPHHRAAFFRQSGWLMFVNIAAGAMMWAVHFLSKRISTAEYGTLVTLFTLTILIPAIPLQMVYAQQTAAGLARGERRQLAQKIRTAWLVSFLVWLAVAVPVLVMQNAVLRKLSIANPAALWMALLLALGYLWLPLAWGLLQGAQNFLMLGVSMLLNGVGRIGLAALLVLAWHGQAASIVAGATVGVAVAFGLGMWQTRDLWTGPGERFEWHGLLRQIVPLLLGFGATLFLFSADTVFVKIWFPNQTAFYGSAGTLSRGLIWLVGPLAAVMFPKVVHSTARSEKSNLLTVTLVATALLAAGGVGGLWLLGPWVVKLVYTPAYVTPTTTILLWYAAAMVPLALANVLVNHLLAKSDFRIVPWLVGLALAYVLALLQFHASPVQVLQVLGVACTVLFAICAWFTYGNSPARGGQTSA